MGIIERKERQRKGLREEILRAALEVFATEGYKQLSMRKLAERIEYSPTTIYSHFEDKDELFECVCEQTFSQLSDLLCEIVTAASDPVDAFRKCCRAYIEFGLRHPDQYKVAFLLDSGQNLAPAEVLERFPKAMEAFYRLRTGLQACMATGQFAQGDPDLLSQIVWAGLHGLTSLLITKPSFPWLDRDILIEVMVQTILKSLHNAQTISLHGCGGA